VTQRVFPTASPAFDLARPCAAERAAAAA